jgi:FtsH-binding integral membrane protein
MFIGHFGLGFGLKRAAPGVSLGTLLMAVAFVDLLWPTFLLLGVEHVEIAPGITAVTPLDFVDYPISHSLVMMAAWGLLFGGVYWAIKRSRVGAAVCGLAVVSHWFLDWLMHRPDLPLYPGASPVFGLGLWNSLPATIVAEFAVFGAGLAVYLRTTQSVDRHGTIGLWSLTALLVAIQLANLFGPPPPSVQALAVAGHAQWLLVAAGYWVDRHRRATS